MVAHWKEDLKSTVKANCICNVHYCKTIMNVFKWRLLSLSQKYIYKSIIK